MEENEFLVLHTFEHNGRTFKYDYNMICCDQAENARVVGQYADNQKKTMPDSIQEMLNAKEGEILFIIAGYILTEFKDGVRVPYSPDKVGDIITWAKSLSVTERNKLVECSNDFFISIGLPSLSCIFSPSEKDNKSMLVLQQVMREMMNGNPNSEL
jgi:hypothetical protein